MKKLLLGLCLFFAQPAELEAFSFEYVQTMLEKLQAKIENKYKQNRKWLEPIIAGALLLFGATVVYQNREQILLATPPPTHPVPPADSTPAGAPGASGPGVQETGPSTHPQDGQQAPEGSSDDDSVRIEEDELPTHQLAREESRSVSRGPYTDSLRSQAAEVAQPAPGRAAGQTTVSTHPAAVAPQAAESPTLPMLFFVPTNELEKIPQLPPRTAVTKDGGRFIVELFSKDLNIVLRPPCFCARASMIAITDTISTQGLNVSNFSHAILGLAQDYMTQYEIAPWQSGTPIQIAGGEDLECIMHPIRAETHSALESGYFAVNIGEFQADTAKINFEPIRENIQRFITNIGAELVLLVLHKGHYFVAQLKNKGIIDGKQLLQTSIFETEGITTDTGIAPNQHQINEKIIETLGKYADPTKIQADFLEPILTYLERIARDMPIVHGAAAAAAAASAS